MADSAVEAAFVLSAADLEEELILGAALLAPALIPELAERFDATDLTDLEREAVWAAIMDVHGRREPVGALSVAAVLGDRDRNGRLWGMRLANLQAEVGFAAEALPIAARIHERAEARRLALLLDGFAHRARTEPSAVVRADVVSALSAGPPVRSDLLTGGAWILDRPATLEAVWGDGDAVVWSRGEPLLIVGPDGTYKTTLLAHLALGLLGLFPSVLGMPVQEVDRVLYLAADRPRQIRRRFAQLVAESERSDLERLIVHEGPLGVDLMREPTALAAVARSAGAAAILVDSLGAIVPSLAKDETGGAVRIAIDHLIAADVEVCVAHHNRKAGTDGREPRKLEDVYGSRWLTAGAGSVVSLWGDPGAPVVSFRHLKQPASEVGPFRIEATPEGWMQVQRGSDLMGLLARPGGIEPRQAAAELYEVGRPTRADVQRARRALDRAVTDRIAVILNPERAASEPARYAAAAPQTWLEEAG